MNFRLLLCLAMGMFTTYMGLVMLVGHFRAKPGGAPPPKPNFSARVEESVDAETGEKIVHRQITVSTKLAEPGLSQPARTAGDPAK
jgi:hypothetical protein